MALSFSTEPDTCGAYRAKKIAAGSSIVEVLTCETTAGSYEPYDIRVRFVDPSCPSGSDVNESLTRGASELPGAAVTLTRVEATVVEGSLSFALEDGSTFSGSFSVPTCPGAVRETTTAPLDAGETSVEAADPTVCR